MTKKMTKPSCQHCGRDYEKEAGYDDNYCSEECWETATDYGNDAV